MAMTLGRAWRSVPCMAMTLEEHVWKSVLQHPNYMLDLDCFLIYQIHRLANMPLRKLLKRQLFSSFIRLVFVWVSFSPTNVLKNENRLSSIWRKSKHASLVI